MFALAVAFMPTQEVTEEDWHYLILATWAVDSMGTVRITKVLKKVKVYTDTS